MAKNQYLSAINEADAALQKQYAMWEAIDKKILSLSQNARKNFDSAFDGSSIKGVSTKINNNAKSVNYLNETLKEQKRLEDGVVKALVKKEQALSQNAKAISKQRLETQLINKANKEQSVLSSTLTTEYQKLNVRLNQMIRKYQDLAAKKAQSIPLTKKESQQYRRLSIQIRKADTSLKQIDAQTGRNFRNVGNYGKALVGLGRSLRTLASAFGLTSGVFLFAEAVQDAFKRVREFDKSMQNLAGVFRTTRPELKDLEQTIIDVASATIRTSNEVAELANTLATLGKSPDQIEKLLKPIVDLSLGLDAPADEAGEFLIQMLNAFGKSEDSAMEFADTIATIRTSTTLDFQKMRDGFQYIAPISRILNKDLAYTGSIVGILADNSLKAEQASRLLSTAQIKLATQNRTLDEALSEINKAYKEGKDGSELLALANESFGKQAAKVGVILALNSDAIERNAQSIRDNGGALKDLTDRQLESFDAKLKILDSTYESFILNLDNGTSSLGSFSKKLIDISTNNLKKWDAALNGSNSILDRFKLLVNASSKDVFGLNPVLEQGEGFFQDYTDSIINAGDALMETSKEIENQNKKFIEAHGSLAPLTEEYQRLLDTTKKVKEEVFEFTSSTNNQGKSIADLRSDIKTLNDELELLDSTDKAGIKTTQNKIKAKQDELNAILGVNKSSKKSIKRAKEQVKAFEGIQEAAIKTKDDLGELFIKGLISAKQYQTAVERIDKSIKDLSEGIEAIKQGDLLEGLQADGVPYMLDSVEELSESLKNLPWEEALSKANEVFGEIGNLASTLYDRNIQGIEDEINKNDEKYAKLLANEQLSLEQRAALEAEAELKRQQLEAKKREELRKQAVAKKAFDAASIIANTAVAISKTLAETGFLGIPLTAIVAAQGAIQLATVLAQPIPQFEDGLFTDYQGPGIINDKKESNYREILMRKSGQLEMFNERNKVVDIKKGDRILPAQTSQNIINNAVAQSYLDGEEKLARTQVKVIQKTDKELANRIEKAIAKIVIPKPTSAGEIGRETAKALQRNSWDI